MSTNQHPHTHFGDLASRTSSRLALSLLLTLLFVFVEAAAGWISNSLALLSDAGHNLTDVLALGLSWLAVVLSARPANGRRTYGYLRAGILAALFNAATLAGMAVWIFYEAYQRFINPPAVNAPMLVTVGLLAVVVNLVTAWLIHRDSAHDLNIRSAFVHLMGDVFSTLGAVAAGILITFTGWNWLDPVASTLIAILILWNAWGILREAVDILLESTPGDVNIDQLVADLLRVPGVHGIHDLHVWSVNQSLRTLSAHVVTEDMSISAGADIQAELVVVLQQHYGIAHATLQLEAECCAHARLYCALAE